MTVDDYHFGGKFGGYALSWLSSDASSGGRKGGRDKSNVYGIMCNYVLFIYRLDFFYFLSYHR